jgi:hypothetical protein
MYLCYSVAEMSGCCEQFWKRGSRLYPQWGRATLEGVKPVIIGWSVRECKALQFVWGMGASM